MTQLRIFLAHALWLLGCMCCLVDCQAPEQSPLQPPSMAGGPPLPKGLNLDDISPRFASSVGGSIVTLRGSDFTSSTRVSIDGIASPMVWFESSSTLMAQVPSNLGRQGLVQVEVRNDTTSVGRSDLFAYQSAQIRLRRSNGTGARPVALVLADVDGDMRKDIVTANTDGDSVSILRGRGDGSFDEPVDYPMGSQPKDVVVTDLNRDGRADVVTANYAGNSLSIRMGTASGLGQEQPMSLGNGPWYLAASDLNLDGNPDLIVGDLNQVAVHVLLGQGNGSFSAPKETNPGGVLGGLLVRDLDGDGKPDLITTNRGLNQVEVRLGLGDGSFGSARSTATGASPMYLGCGDVNRDGKLDLIVANFGSSDLSFLSGKGDGTFLPEQRLGYVGSISAITLADFDGDGALDLALANYSELSMASVVVLRGKGNGTFESWASETVDSNPSDMASADLNGDGVPDIVSVANQQNSASVLLGDKGSAILPDSREIVCPKLAGKALLADVDSDGKLDLVCPDSGSKALRILSGRGDGTFALKQTLPVDGSPYAVSLFDMNQDGSVDLVSAHQDGSAIGIALLDPQTHMHAAPQNYLAGVTSDAMAIADFDHNGTGDFALCDGTDSISVYLTKASGAFGDKQSIKTANNCFAVKSADLNLDGHPDLAVLTSDRLQILFYNGDGKGGFSLGKSVAIGGFASDFLLADVSGDGRPDLIAPNTNEYFASLSLAVSGGGFRKTTALPLPLLASVVGSADLDGDGRPELLFGAGSAFLQATNFGALQNMGNGTFAGSGAVVWTARVEGILIGDVDRDGKTDVIFQQPNSLVVHFNRSR